MPDDSELSDQQERVRRLLAQARVDEPMPDDVVERLDRVLARLADEEHESPATVVELATRRRRKAATLLVAAAAVVVVGVGAGNLLPGSVIGGDGDSGAASDAQLPAGASAQEDERGAFEAAPESGFDGSANGVTKAQYRIRPDHFADDVARINDVSDAYATGSTAEQDPQDGVGLDAELTRTAFICDPAPWGVGRLVAVRYAGAPAVLAFRPPAGESQVVDLLECGTAEILRSVTLPAH